MHRAAYADFPTLQVFSTRYCNLKCQYCSQREHTQTEQDNDFLLSDGFLRNVDKLLNVHFLLTGGEPFLCVKGIKNLLRLAIKNGHVLSFQSNVSMPNRILQDILADAPSTVLGHIIACHHLHSGVDDQEFVRNVLFLHDKGFDIEAKYLAIPGDLETVSRWMAFWRQRDIKTTVGLLMGPWNGRVFPTGYTDEEILTILPMSNSLQTALCFFDGFPSKNLPCYGGNIDLSWNMAGDGKIVTCCHGLNSPIAWKETSFVTGVRRRIPCRHQSCWRLHPIDAIGAIIREYESSLPSGIGGHPTIAETATVARKIEKSTGRRFNYWPSLFEKTARELGLGMADDSLLDLPKKEIYSLPEGECLPQLEIRSCGGVPVLAIYNGCIAMRTFSVADSLRTPFFDIPESDSERTNVVVSFEKVNLQLGDFSWRLVVQNYQLETLLKKTFRLDPKHREAVATVTLPLSWFGKVKKARLIFAPVGTVGSSFVLGKSIRMYTCVAAK